MLNPPVRPKNGRVVQVLVACRVSDPREGKQDERSNQDQRVKLEAWLKAELGVPFEITSVEGQGRGEYLERSDFLELTRLVESRRFDLLITEDIGRIMRRMHAHIFVETCLEFETRVITLNDHIDTAVPGWEDRSIFSSWHHERSNRDTSDRIKRTHRSRFRDGGCAQFPIAGIIKPPGSKNDAEWRKDPAFEPVFQSWARMIEDGASLSHIADVANRDKVPTGPFCDSDEWTGVMVNRVFRNPLLHGERYRNKKKTVRNSKGKYKCVTADPSETAYRAVPHLAFFEPTYHNYLIGLLDARKLKNKRRTIETANRVARKPTRFPGQMIFCGICGRMLVFGGSHGQSYLQCDGSRKHRCWNGVHLNSDLAARKLLDAVQNEVEELPAYDESFLALVHDEAARCDEERQRKINLLVIEVDQLQRQIDNLVDALAKGIQSHSVREKLKECESSLSSRKYALGELQRIRPDVVDIPSIDELKQLARASLTDLAMTDDWELQQAIRRMIPKITVFPVQCVDGGKVCLRAKFHLYPGNALGDDRSREALSGVLRKVLIVDLFESPQRVYHREAIVEHRADGKTEREAAELCAITSTAAQHAAMLQRKMDKLEVSDPYQYISSPPVESRKLRREQHPRYRFEPLPGAGEW